MKMSSSTRKAHLCLPLLVLGAPISYAATPAPAEVADAPEQPDLQEVVVTAERRESTVQKTSFSITAITGEDLTRKGLSRIEDVAAETPGISMKQFAPGYTEFEMRGLSSTGGNSATVGLYVNDVPMAAPAFSPNGKPMIDPDLYDLQRVEVLRGPQGTLYGAGSMGGTIRLITAPPQLNKFEGSGQTILSSTRNGGFNWGQSGALNLPLVQDRVALRLDATEKYNTGWIDRIAVSPFPIGPSGSCGYVTCVRGNVQSAPVVGKQTDINWNRLRNARASLVLQATDRLTFDFMGMYQGLSSGGFPWADASVGIQNLDHYSPFSNSTPFNDTYRIASFTVNYALDFAKLTSVSSYWNRNSWWRGDASETIQSVINTYFGDPAFESPTYYNSDRSKQWSEEVRLTSTGSGPLQWVVGGFYSSFTSVLDQNYAAADYAPLSVGGAAANPDGIIFTLGAPYHIKQDAAFAEGSYRFADSWKATAGIRWFRYTDDYTHDDAGIFSPTGNASHELSPTVRGSASGVNPKFNLSYEPTRDLTVYTEIAKGFRPGGVNTPVPSFCGNQVPQTYSPDSIWNYEVGEKARLAGGRVTVNADFYYIRWTGVQQQVTLPCSYLYSTNVGTGESYGPELELTAHLTQHLAFSLNGSYTNAKLVSVNPSVAGNV